MNPLGWSNSANLIGFAVAVWGGLAVAVLIYAKMQSGNRRKRILSGVAVGAVAFQVFHFAEHAVQTVYWAAHPTAKPYLTPWAASAGDGLGFFCSLLPGKGAETQRGVEVLHLVGNSIFYVGVIAMFALARGAKLNDRSAKRGMWVQGFHVVEHVVLVATVFIGGKALGVSTNFGLVDGTTAFASSYRVWFHFGINMMATVCALHTINALRKNDVFQMAPVFGRRVTAIA